MRFQTLYRRLAARQGHKRAILAVAHRLLVVAYQLLRTGEAYRELGAGGLDDRQPEVLVHNLAKRIQTLGISVNLEFAT